MTKHHQRAKQHEIVIVGGGPVGLWTGIQLKKRQSNAVVTIYERYLEYQRNHVLRLEYTSMLLHSKANRDLREEVFFREVTGKSLPQIVLRPTGSVFVRTNDLERALKLYAQAVGVEVRYERAASPEAIMQAHPTCQTFIAADGAHSAMRAALLGEDAIEHLALQHAVEVKYQAEGKVGYLGSIAEQYKTNKLLTNMAFEYVGHEREGITPVTIRFFLDKETYDGLPEANFKAPLLLDDVLDDKPDASPALSRLARDIATYMKARQTLAGEIYRPCSGRLTKLVLSLYAANRFAVLHKDNRTATEPAERAWYLVGDAAMGVPYFRALNAGIILGSQLANILNSGLSTASKVQAYNAFRPLHIAWEFTAARGKNSGLSAYNLLRKAVAEVPWQLVKWDDETASQFRAKHQIALRPDDDDDASAPLSSAPK